MRFRTASGIVTILFSLSSAHASERTEGEHFLGFRDRKIDMKPFLLGYPFSDPAGEVEFGHLFYLEETAEGTWLRFQQFTGNDEVDLSKGRKAASIDWSTRNWKGGRYFPPSESYYFLADEENDERWNIYALDLKTSQVDQVTFHEEIYGWSFSEDYRLLAYIAGRGARDPAGACLKVRDMTTGEERDVLCDGDGPDRFTRSRILFTEDGNDVIVTIQRDEDPRMKTLARIGLNDSVAGFDHLIQPRVIRDDVSPLEEWCAETEFMYESSETGFRNVYRYDLITRQSQQLTDLEEELASSHVIDTDPKTLLLIVHRPNETQTQLRNAETGKLLLTQQVPYTVEVLDVHGDSGLFEMSSLTSPMRLQFFTVGHTGGQFRNIRQRRLAMATPEVTEEVIQANVRQLSFKTFDKLKHGPPRTLHGFYMEPKTPPEDPRDRLVVIDLSQGGGNEFQLRNHVLAAAGIATMSPALRGSAGFGAEFAALDDSDLGGDEVRDVTCAAKWLVDQIGYEPGQIGVYGEGRGGYAALRCLTLPRDDAGGAERFDFGFGISRGGFFDLSAFDANSTPLDWIRRKAGRLLENPAEMTARSPLRNIGLLKVPLLLIHGGKDGRFPPDGSREFAETASSAGKGVILREFPGQGHDLRGVENRLAEYRAIFDFLGEIPSAGGR